MREAVARHHQRAPLVTLAHDLEEQARARFVQGQVTQFVEDEQRRRDRPLQFRLETVQGLGRVTKALMASTTAVKSTVWPA
jgi:hypothetical protein